MKALRNAPCLASVSDICYRINFFNALLVALLFMCEVLLLLYEFEHGICARKQQQRARVLQMRVGFPRRLVVPTPIDAENVLVLV